MIKIIIVDDHFVVREGLKGILDQYEDLQVVAEAADGVTAVQKVGQYQPDVVLMDLRMSGGDGLTAIKQIKRNHKKVHVLVLTTYEDEDEIEQAIAAGATGFLLKDTPRNSLVAAIRGVAKGESTLSPRVASKLMQKVRQKPVEVAELLSERECEVLDLVAQGHPNRTVAYQLRISEATVKTHLVHIFNKLEVQDRTSAVLAAIQKGYIKMPE